MFKVNKFKDQCGDPYCEQCPLHYCEIDMIEEGDTYFIGRSMGFRTEYLLDQWVEKALKTLEEAKLRIRKESEPLEMFLH